MWAAKRTTRKEAILPSIASTFGLRSGLRQQRRGSAAAIFGTTESRCPDTIPIMILPQPVKPISQKSLFAAGLKVQLPPTESRGLPPETQLSETGGWGLLPEGRLSSTGS